MRTKIILIAFVMSLSSLLFAQEFKKDDAVENYRQQISALNLVNGLYLTPTQGEKILKVLYNLKDVQEEYQQKLNSLIPDLREEYKKLYQEVAENKGISKATEKSAGTLHKQELDLRDEYMSRLVELENKLKGELTENQMCIIDDFKPCLIPPKNLKDPARVGQAKGDASMVIDWLERIRNVPDRRYPFARERFINEYIDRYEKIIEVLTQEKKNEEINRVSRILDEARNLSSIDFEMKKEELGKQLIIEKEQNPIKRKYEVGKIGRILLDTRLIPILEKRLFASK
jgi:hypothetical protein